MSFIKLFENAVFFLRIVAVVGTVVVVVNVFVVVMGSSWESERWMVVTMVVVVVVVIVGMGSGSVSVLVVCFASFLR